MGKIAILAEKPSQARAYAEAFKIKQKEKTFIELEPCPTFPAGAVITWGIGHLVELKEPKEYKKEWEKWSLASLPIFLDKYEDKVVSHMYSQFQAVKKIFHDPQVTMIYNACDAEREGANIFYSIYKMTKVKKPVKRLWINSLEVDEIRKGFLNMQSNEQDLLMYQEAKTRQISDWLVGMNCSRLYTLLLQQKGFKGSISIGRVQSPTVYLIYKRLQEIENFKPENFYEIEGLFKAQQGIYKGKAKLKTKVRAEAEQLLQQHGIQPIEMGQITSVVNKTKHIQPPKLHALSTLQATANKRWKYSPAHVLKLTQSLYEKKLVSYPRTDSQLITHNEYSYLQETLPKYQQLIGKSFMSIARGNNKRYVDSANVGEHYAIIPTKKIPTAKALQSMLVDERNIYMEIVRTTLAMFHQNYEYDEKTIITNVKNMAFKSVGKTELIKGWKELFDEEKEPRQQEEALPAVIQGEMVQGQIAIVEGTTTPPKPYTEGQLITMMKTCGKAVEDEAEIEVLNAVEGIGTEATRSGIIETIKKHGFIEVKKNIVNITPKGELLCQAIEGTLLASPSMTAKWEIYLKKIGRGEGSVNHFIENIGKFINQLIAEVPNQINQLTIEAEQWTQAKAKDIVLCPTCKVGTISLRKKFYGCSAYKDGCKQTFPERLLGKKLTEKNIKDLCSNGKTSTIKGFKAKSGKSFSAALYFVDGKIEFDFNRAQ
ncbi:type IA DNA topoisomerase [Lysinibacillus piscis]|uniref:DNA topoisomerase n=1 Tax=Lysinibacillus piscis TaxID=2518931 RepID=A0ABQ5NKI2_9BACI|nr:type IA DNA topoisomerase [Lysinibacillus sp. KH24]GLC88858.1 DNA topoisomerase [Lysinibacillus sp. KH24]